MNQKLELRMFGLVPYNVSEIQKGIQFGHSVVEYGQVAKYCGDPKLLELYNDWADNWKTVILLNGGTTNLNIKNLGSLNQHLNTLHEIGVDVATFNEPDLGDQLSAICFIVDERVFNREDYPEFEDWAGDNYSAHTEVSIKYLNSEPKTLTRLAQMIQESNKEEDKKFYQKWVDLIGGEKNVKLREFLHPKNFRLA
jgi:hypothetical protein